MLQPRRHRESQRTSRAPNLRDGLLYLGVICQAITIVITWQLWEVRQHPVNLPLVPSPGIAFGFPLLASLLAVLIWPQRGLALHAALYGISIAFDQYRLQPQFLSLIVLMGACVSEEGAWLARWYLVSMWLWSGLHKLASPEWPGEQSWFFLRECGLPAEHWHVEFAIAVGVGEVLLALTAALAPRRAALVCALVHLGILLLLSPLMRNYNASVWPWNLATAVIGAWVLHQASSPPAIWLWKAARAALLVLPAGYYLDLVNPHLAFVLYSGNLPQALHIAPSSVTRLGGWEGLAVPFPDSPALFVQCFRRTASPGDKLHIDEPRLGLADRYYVMRPDRSVERIPREAFLAANPEAHEVVGREIEDRFTLWELVKRGVSLEPGQGQLISAVKLSGAQCTDDTLLRLAGLSNVETLSISGAEATDVGLQVLGQLPRLEILEIKHCGLSEATLLQIGKMHSLRWLGLENVPVTNRGLAALTALRQLEVLRLAQTATDDACCTHLSQLTSLQWLDLSHTRVSSEGMSALTPLVNLRWLRMNGTRIDDEGLHSLAQFRHLETIELSASRISAAGLRQLAAFDHLRRLNLESVPIGDDGIESLAALRNLTYLNLRNTRVSPAGAQKLEKLLPGCRLEH